MTRSSQPFLTRALGWFSIGLGAAQVLAPPSVARGIGIRPRRKIRNALFAVGLRELGAGVGILSRRGPAAPLLWARAAGDVMDVGLLALASRVARDRSRRNLVAFAAVLGAFALDVFAAMRASRRRTRRRHTMVAITLRESPDVVAAVWLAAQQRTGVFFHLDSIDEVDLRPGPDGRGTELRVRAEGLLREEEVRNDLRRLKQLVETGEVVHSDASIHTGPHPARPTTPEELQ